ncbi:S1 family peptidase [Mycobacterium interjectum]|uniref:S1 family peptidase n=1 Tax=Mycobacterium interjectum TaxID=33895 RepID=UPI000A5584C3|nr:S1 family peptidase [Mycobacterium interjectum]
MHQPICDQLSTTRHESSRVATWTSRIGPPVAAFAERFQKRAAYLLALGTGLLAAMASTAAPAAAAHVDLAVGMPIEIGNHSCSLGFFGFNARQDRLAVTAGHCSDSTPNEPVFADNGVEIGGVVAWKQDLQNDSGKLVGARGYTIIAVYKRFSLQPFFSGIRSSISEGDYVTKFGQRTGKTNGVIKSVQYDPKRPDLALLSSNMVQLPGDSGCPWYTSEDALVGMGSSGDQELQGGDAGSQAQPISAVLDMIRANGGVWGEDFKVWTQ